jgi:hypothetical protein
MAEVTILLFTTRKQVALRVGRHWFGVRSSVMPEYYAERNRIGWKVRYLPFGWRAFYNGTLRQLNA